MIRTSYKLFIKNPELEPKISGVWISTNRRRQNLRLLRSCGQLAVRFSGFITRLKYLWHVAWFADPGGRAVWGSGLRHLDYWDRCFKLRWRHGSTFFVLCVSCVCSGLWDQLITRSEEPYRVCVCVRVCVSACVRVCVCVCVAQKPEY